jgi:hypothetical protein
VAVVALGSILLLQAPWAASGNTSAQPATVAVNCEPNQQAIVRQTIVNGETHVNIQCVGAGGAQPVVYTDQYGRPLQVVPANTVGATQAAYVPQQAPVYAAQPVYAPQPVARSTVASQRRVVSERVPEKKRSWQKSALVIGGSAGTGAGVGGLVAGKKGALVGAAIGGGAASIYESAKR